MNFNSWSDIASIVGAVVSIISVVVTLNIYRSWSTQKQREVVSNDANVIIKEIRSLKLEIFEAREQLRIDYDFLISLGRKRDLLEHALKTIDVIDKDLEYVPYIASITGLIEKWEVSYPTDDVEVMVNFGKKTNELQEYLIKLKLFK